MTESQTLEKKINAYMIWTGVALLFLFASLGALLFLFIMDFIKYVK